MSSNVKRADELKNATASLQEELRKNMSALEDKLKRAREHVAKVDNSLLCWDVVIALFEFQSLCSF